MSLLEKFADNEKSTGYLGARVPAELESKFKEHCRKNKISVAAALRLLVENELGSAGVYDTNTAMAIAAEYARADKAARPSADSLPAAAQQKPKKPNNSTHSDKGALKYYEIGGKMPCPVCVNWTQYSTFKDRHTKKHGFTDTLEFFKAHADMVEQMRSGRLENTDQ